MEQGGLAQQSGIEDADVVDRFQTYEDYLDSYVTDTDLFYLEDEATARRVVELGYLHGNGELLKRSEFGAKKAAIAQYRSSLLSKKPKPLLGAGRQLAQHPLLQAIAERERAIREGSLATILFVRAHNAWGQEVSGYIDLGHRLAADEAGMEAVFSLERPLLPHPTDLSFLNWHTHTVAGAATQNFEVVVDAREGLLFRCIRDRKVMAVDPQAPTPGDYSTRTELRTPEAIQAVFFDHVVGRRA